MMPFAEKCYQSGLPHSTTGSSLLKHQILKKSVCICFDHLFPDIQGIDEGPQGLKLISEIIREKLHIEVNVLMGANIANEVADEKFCETTIGEYMKMIL